MAVYEMIPVESNPSRPMVAGRAHPLRVAAAALVVLGLLLEVTASLAAHRTKGAPQFRTYPAPSRPTVVDPRC